MFKELDKYVQNPRRIIDIGCGYGVPATWLLEIYPQAKVYGLEPDEVRVLIASRVIGNRGSVVVGRAPDLPQVEGEVDYVLMLDMLHLISDKEVQIAFQRIYEKLSAGWNITCPGDNSFGCKKSMETLDRNGPIEIYPPAQQIPW